MMLDFPIDGSGFAVQFFGQVVCVRVSVRCGVKNRMFVFLGVVRVHIL